MVAPPVPISTTTKSADYMGRAVVTPSTDARDHMNRACMAGDRDYLGRLLIGATGPPPPPPSTATVTHLDPASVQAGGMVSVIVNGTGFLPAVRIEVGANVSQNQSYLSPTQVQTNYLFPQTPGVY